MDSLDLDIDNYDAKDIETFFKINRRKPYTKSDVELKETQMREQVLKSGHIDKRIKTDFLDFLVRAKNKLIDMKFPAPPIPTAIPKNYQLDPYDIPKSAIPLTREGDLIQRKDTSFMYTQQSEYFPGTLNPLDTRILSKCLTVDTRFRDNYFTTQSSDFTFQLPLKFSKVVSMQLSSFEIPVSFYGISSSYGNNYLHLRIKVPSTTYDDEPELHERIFIIPDGNYNAQDLIDKINDLLCPKTFDGSPLNPDDMFSYVHFKVDITESGSGTGKVMVEPCGCLSTKILEIFMDFKRDIHGNPDNVNISSKIGWNLGFIREKYSGSNTYTSETLIEPASIRYIYLAVDDFNNSVNNHFVTAFNQSILNPNILARISIKGTYFSLLMENDLSIVTEPRKYFGPVDIQRLRIRLYDDHGRLLNMNGANFSFCLVFKMLYDL